MKVSFGSSRFTLLETEVEIELNQLPKGVLENVKANYKGQKLKDASKITDAKGSVIYEAEIKGKALFFDSNGEFIKEIKKLNLVTDNASKIHFKSNLSYIFNYQCL